MKRLLLLGAVALSLSANAFTGNDLHGVMQDGSTDMKLVSIAYVRGFMDATIIDRLARGATKTSTGIPAICMPDGATTEQAVEIVRAHLAANPASRHLDAGVLTSIALSRAWPCR